MCANGHEEGPRTRSSTACSGSTRGIAPTGLSRREFLGGVGAAAAIGGLAGAGTAGPAVPLAGAAPEARGGQAGGSPTTGLLPGAALRVKPALVFQLYSKRETTSWRAYGGLHTRDDVDREARRIEAELRALSSKAEFPLEILPLSLVGSDADAASVSDGDGDVILVYASGGDQGWLERMAASKKPNVMFLRHRSGPFYLWYEIAHFRFLRKSEDAFKEPNMDVDDIVVDDYDDVLWRLRSLYGLKNARGTRVVAVGGLAAYTTPGQQVGPAHVKEAWGFDLRILSHDALEARLGKARGDDAFMEDVRRETDAFLKDPKVTLETDRRFVLNSFLAARVLKDIMNEAGAKNLGVAHCMGSLIRLLDTPPCLILSLLNDEGYTAFCHTDFTHTPPGVLLRWISGKPSFVSNSHFPHHGILTLAHCSAPRRMNGRDYEPTRILTHFESDYGAATKVEFTKGQVTTNIIPNFLCTRWFGLRGRIIDTPFFDICRSQIDLEIDGDWRKLLREMEGFHTITCYGDYLREIGYALKKAGIEWVNVSEVT